MDEQTKRAIHCGWLDESEWVGEKPTFDKPWIGDPMDAGARVDISGLNVCPGWVVRQPFVATACQAHGAFEKQAIETFFPGKENVALEAAMCLAHAYGVHQLVQIRNSK